MPPAAQSEKVASGTNNTPLPPSVEKAYYIKCVELKRRIREIEDANAVGYLRKKRLRQGIHKLQMQQAVLLDHLQKLTDENVDGSDRSDTPPPTPQDKPLRSKRSHRKPSPGGVGSGSADAAGTSSGVPDKTGQDAGLITTTAPSHAMPAAAIENVLATPPSYNAPHAMSAVSTPDVQRSTYFGAPGDGREQNGTPLGRAGQVAGTAEGGRENGLGLEDGGAAPSHKREEDTEMADAPPAAATGANDESGTGGGGFTAVNRG